MYRMHLSKNKLYEYIHICLYYQEFFDLLKKIFLKRKKEIFKLITQKIKKKRNNNSNKIMNTKRKIIMKAN